MSNEHLQFIFSLFSFVGVIGILFYLILQKTKNDRLHEKIEELEEDLFLLKEEFYKPIDKTQEIVSEKKEDVPNESTKERIIHLYEQGMNTMLIENQLNVPKATINMVLKFHNMNKANNWRNSSD